LEETGEEHAAEDGNCTFCIAGYLKEPFLYIVFSAEAPFFPDHIKQHSTAEVVGWREDYFYF
jgi:hypothetical protein